MISNYDSRSVDVRSNEIFFKSGHVRFHDEQIVNKNSTRILSGGRKGFADNETKTNLTAGSIGFTI